MNNITKKYNSPIFTSPRLLSLFPLLLLLQLPLTPQVSAIGIIDSLLHHHHGTLLQYDYYPSTHEHNNVDDTLKAYCYNSHRRCENWALHGNWCVAYEGFMEENCRASCGGCDQSWAKRRQLGRFPTMS